MSIFYNDGKDNEVCSSCGKPYEDCECDTDIINPQDFVPAYDKKEEPVWR